MTWSAKRHLSREGWLAVQPLGFEAQGSLSRQPHLNPVSVKEDWATLGNSTGDFMFLCLSDFYISNDWIYMLITWNSFINLSWIYSKSWLQQMQHLRRMKETTTINPWWRFPFCFFLGRIWKAWSDFQALVHGHTMTCHNSTGYGSSCVSLSSCPSMSGKDVRVRQTRVQMPYSSKQRRGGWEGWAHDHISSTNMTCTFASVQFLFKLTFFFLTKQPTFLTHRLFCQALPHDRAGPRVQENEEQEQW